MSEEMSNDSEEMSENMSNDSDEMVLSDTIKKPKEMSESDNSENLSTDSDMSNGLNVESYLSSSAHTDNIDSSTNVTTISIGNRKVLSDSINTSDINMISIDE